MAEFRDLALYWVDQSRKGLAPHEATAAMSAKFKGISQSDKLRAAQAGLDILAAEQQILSGQVTGPLSGLNIPKLGPGNVVKFHAIGQGQSASGGGVFTAATGSTVLSTMIQALLDLILWMISHVKDNSAARRALSEVHRFAISKLSIWIE